jgi:hypothetical protein
MAKKTQKKKPTNIFFVRRRPRFSGIGRDWQPPENEDEYQKLIDSENFISVPVCRTSNNIDLERFPVICQDVRDLEQHLLPVFFDFVQRAKYYQNRFYLYQWTFVLGAFATTVFGTLAAYTSGTQVKIFGDVEWTSILSIATAIIGALTAYYTTVSNHEEPQKRWGQTRRIAEELRMHYYTYLSHLAPYEKDDRIQKLRENIVNIRSRERRNG